MSHFHIVLFMSFPPSGILRAMACSPVGLISLKDRELRPVIDKVRDRFPVKPEFFQVLNQPFRLFI